MPKNTGMWARLYNLKPIKKVKAKASNTHSPRYIRDTINGFHKD